MIETNIRQQLKYIDSPSTKLLSEVDDYAIYSFFIGEDVLLGCLINSPLRTDTNPTFSLFYPTRVAPRWPGQIIFKDFVGPSGNVFRFVQLFASYHYNKHLDSLGDICEYITEAMKIGTIARTKVEYVPIQLYKADYGFQSMPYTERHIEFWNDLGAAPGVLQLYDVRAAKYLLDGTRIVKDLEKLTVFSYVIYDKFKLYNPSGEGFQKFFNQCPADYVQGYQQCRGTWEKLVITKAMKDIIVMQSHVDKWVDIIAPHGEGYYFSDLWIAWILQYHSIVIIFDYDLAGVKGVNKLKKQLLAHPNYSGQEIAVRFVSTKRILKNGYMPVDVKDSADFRLMFGEQPTKKLLNRLIYGTIQQQQVQEYQESRRKWEENTGLQSLESEVPF